MDAEELKARTLDSYNSGWRAYMSFNGTLFQQKGTKPVMPFIEVSKYQDQIEEWHALRAYQDEQRKKGVPVKLSLGTQDEYNKRIQWYRLDGKLDSHLIDDGSPYILIFGSQSYKQSGRFCNFRYKPEWLEKHKKQTI